jgi:ABC-2 type transport system ATP-binding protein
MIQAESLTKRYGSKTAVDAIGFTVQSGKVTGFLGPNGAGKSTTMRMIVGLDRPTSGSVTVNGKAYREHHAPLREVGVLLDAKAVHTGRTVYNLETGTARPRAGRHSGLRAWPGRRLRAAPLDRLT